MKINIVNLDKDGWILTKFAKNIYKELKKKGLKVFLSKKPKENVDINRIGMYTLGSQRKNLSDGH